jgi:hypothetical protein
MIVFDRAAVLASGLPVPPLNRAMNWEVDDAEEEGANVSEDPAMAEKEKELDDLLQPLNHEFALYGMNEHRLNSFAMFADLDEKEVGHWVGTLANGPGK